MTRSSHRSAVLRALVPLVPLALLAGGLTSPAAAETVVPATWSADVAACSGTLTLPGDVTTTTDVTTNPGATCVLDLDGHAWTMSGAGLVVGSVLTIKDSSTGGTGSLTITAPRGAGIAVPLGQSLEIASGTVSVTGGGQGAAIGGTQSGGLGTVIVSGGQVTATNTTVNNYSAALGGAVNMATGGGASSGVVHVTGGTVTATAQHGAALGAGGYDAATGSPAAVRVVVDGGVVDATSTGSGAALGGGYGSTSDTSVVLGGGTVRATGTNSAAALGGGIDGEVRLLRVDGATVTATVPSERPLVGTTRVPVALASGSLLLARGAWDAAKATIGERATVARPADGTGTITGSGTLLNQGTLAAPFSGTTQLPGSLTVTGRAYHLGFNPDGGSSEKDLYVYAASASAAGVTLPTPTRAGFAFGGWKDASGTIVDASTALSAFGAADGTVSPRYVPLKATWTSTTPSLSATAQPTTATVGQPYAWTPTHGGTGTFTATGLPAGLTLDATTGRIAGTPEKAGSFQVTLTLTKGAESAQQVYPLAVAAGTITGLTATVIGTPKVGEDLVVQPGATTPSTTPSYAWQRKRATDEGFQPIVGATSATYTLTPADDGAQVRVVVTAAADEHETRTVESTPATVGPGDLVEPELTVSDVTPVTGQEVVATLTNAARLPAGAVVAWQWGTYGFPVPVEDELPLLRSAGPTCTGLAPETPDLAADTHVVTPDEVGEQLCARVTVTAPGYTKRVADVATDAVGNGTFTVGAPTLAGTPKVGVTLTATPADPAAGAPVTGTPTYQWQVATPQDGTPAGEWNWVDVAGATIAAFVPGPEQAGAVARVRVTVPAAGYDDAQASSTPSGRIAAGTQQLAVVLPSTAPRVGGTYTATLGQDTAPATASHAFTWQVWDAAAQRWAVLDTPSARTASLEVPGDAVGRTIRVVVVGTAAGYTRASATSAERTVEEGEIAESPQPPLLAEPGRVAVGTTLVGDLPAGAPEGVVQTVLWGRMPAGSAECAPLADRTGLTYDVVPADLGAQLCAVTRWTRPGYASRTSAPASVSTLVAEGTVTGLGVGVAGTPKVGNTLTATAVEPSHPAATALTYQWERRLKGSDTWTPITDATGTTYALVPADDDTQVRVVVSAAAEAYTTATAASGSVFVAKGTIATPTAVLDDPTPVVGQTLTASLTGATLPADAVVTWQWGRYAQGPPYLYPTPSYNPYLAGLLNTLLGGLFGGPGGPVSGGLPPWAIVPGIPSASCSASGGGSSAADATHLVTPGELGAMLCAQAVITAAGYEPRTVFVTAAAPVARGTYTAPVPTVSGTPQVGAALGASFVLPGADTAESSSFQWQTAEPQDGPAEDWAWTAVPGAVGPGFSPRPQDVGKAARAVLTLTVRGYQQTTSHSLPTAVVAEGAPRSLTVSLPDGDPVVGGTYTVTTSTDEDVTVSYAWQTRAEPEDPWTAVVGDSATTASLAVTPDLVGRQVRVVVTGEAAGHEDAQVASDERTVAAGDLEDAGLGAPTPVLAETTVPVVVGSVLSVTVPEAPSGVEQTVLWGHLSPVDNETCATAEVPATGTSYTVLATDLGARVCVYALRTAPGYEPDSSASDAIAGVVADGTITGLAPTVSGTPQVGQTLTAATGTLTPSDAGVSYAWQSSDPGATERTWTTLTGATGATYVLRDADLGRQLRVAVTAERAGYTKLVEESAGTATVTAAPTPPPTPGPPAPSGPSAFTTKPTVALTGTPQVGTPLVATVTGGVPSEGVTRAYAWLVDGAVVAGATGATYTPVARDLGKPVAVRVTSSAAGFVDDVTSAGAATAVALGQLVLGAPSVTGSGAVGSVLTAVAPTGTSATDTVAYAWQRTSGTTTTTVATGSTYPVTRADVGTTLTLVSTVTRDGYAPVTGSTSLVPTEPAAELGAIRVSVPGAAVVGRVVTAGRVVGEVPSGSAVAYRWLSGGELLSRQRAFRVPARAVGQPLVLQVTVATPGHPARSASASTGAVAPGTISLRRPVITGVAQVGRRLRASLPGRVVPAGAAVSWTWYVDGAVVKQGSGARAAELGLAPAYRGDRVWVVASVRAPGYTDRDAISLLTGLVR